MATQEILLQYKADISDLQAKVSTIEAGMKKTESTFSGAGKKISDAVKNTAASFGNLGGAIIGAFAVDRIIAFGTESVKAFNEAELNAKKLQTAVSVNGGLQDDYQALIEQSKQLQEITIFSDDDIQRAQTMALQFGLTSDQVKQLIPVVTDFASATGQRLQEALQSVLQGVNGMGRGLKLYGVDVDKTLNKQQQLANITQQLSDKFNGQAEVIGKTTFGQLQRLGNQIDDVKENIGEFILSIGESGAAIVNWIANGFKPLDDEIDKTTSALKGTTAEIQRIKEAIDKATLATLQIQFDNLANSADAPKEAIDRLADTIKGIKVDKFKSELDKLSDEDLQKSLEALNKEAQNTSIIFAKQTDLTAQKRIEILKEEIAARQANNKLLKEQQETTPNNKAADDAAKARQKFLEDQIAAQKKANEQLVQLAIDGINDEFEKRREQAEADFNKFEAEQNDLAKQGLITLSQRNALVKQALINFNNEKDKIRKDEKAKELEDATKAADDTTQRVLDNQLAAIRQAFIERGDFSEKAQAELNIAIEEEELKSLKRRLKKYADLGLDTTDIANQIAAKEIDINKAKNDQKNKDDEAAKEATLKTLKEIQDAYATLSSTISDVFKSIFDSQISGLQAQADANKQYFDDQQQAIEDQVNRRLITEGQGEKKSAELKKQRAASEKKSQDEINAIKRKQAEADKLLSLFKIGLELAEAIASLDVIKIAAAGAQLAIVAATPIPKFQKGTEFVKRGDNPIGIDTIPAFLNEGERVVTAEQNKKHWDLYQAIEKGKIDQYVHKIYITPMLKAAQKEYSRSKEKDFASNITNSLAFNGLTAKEADRLRRKGTHISNAEELADMISKRIAKDITRASIYNK